MTQIQSRAAMMVDTFQKIAAARDECDRELEACSDFYAQHVNFERKSISALVADDGTLTAKIDDAGAEVIEEFASWLRSWYETPSE